MCFGSQNMNLKIQYYSSSFSWNPDIFFTTKAEYRKIQISEGLPNSLSSFLGPSRVEHNYLEY